MFLTLVRSYFINVHLDGKQIFVSKYEQKTTIESNKNSNHEANVKWKKQEEALKDEETIAESGRMFIRNLTYTTTEDDIRKLFEKYGILRIYRICPIYFPLSRGSLIALFNCLHFANQGPLSEVNLPVDKVTRKLKGFGTITFLMPEHAIIAYNELDGSVLDGRMLHLLPGKTKTSLEDIDTGTVCLSISSMYTRE
jgi:multiple RNA-binding domain-containing protein 1